MATPGHTVRELMKKLGSSSDRGQRDGLLQLAELLAQVEDKVGFETIKACEHEGTIVRLIELMRHYARAGAEKEAYALSLALSALTNVAFFGGIRAIRKARGPEVILDLAKRLTAPATQEYIVSLLQNLLLDPEFVAESGVRTTVEVLYELSYSSDRKVAEHAALALRNMTRSEKHRAEVEKVLLELEDKRRRALELAKAKAERLQQVKVQASVTLQRVARGFIVRRRMVDLWAKLEGAMDGLTNAMARAAATAQEHGLDEPVLPGFEMGVGLEYHPGPALGGDADYDARQRQQLAVASSLAAGAVAAANAAAAAAAALGGKKDKKDKKDKGDKDKEKKDKGDKAKDKPEKKDKGDKSDKKDKGDKDEGEGKGKDKKDKKDKADKKDKKDKKEPGDKKSDKKKDKRAPSSDDEYESDDGASYASQTAAMVPWSGAGGYPVNGALYAPYGGMDVGFGLGAPSGSLPRDRLSAKLMQAQAETKLRQSMLTAIADPVSMQQLQLQAQQQQMAAMWQAQQQRLAMLAMQQQPGGASLLELQRQQMALMMQQQQRQLQPPPWAGGWDAATPAAGLSSAASLPVLLKGGRAASNAGAYGSSASFAQGGSGNAFSTPTLPSIGGLKAGMR